MYIGEQFLLLVLTKYPIMLQHMAFSSLIVVVFLEEHNDLFILLSLR